VPLYDCDRGRLLIIRVVIAEGVPVLVGWDLLIYSTDEGR